MSRLVTMAFGPSSPLAWIGTGFALAVAVLVAASAATALPMIVAATFAAGALLGLRARIAALAALAFVIGWHWRAPELVTWFGLTAVILTLSLAVLLPERGRLRIPDWLGVLFVLAGLTTLLVGTAFSESDRAVLGLLQQVLAIGIGTYFGQLVAAGGHRGAAWSSANIMQLARELLLGRITTGMIHDMAQPINVVAMANSNLAYLVDQMPAEGGQLPLIRERVDRIAEQADRAAHLLQDFRSFGRQTSGEADDMTVRAVLERAWTTTRSNVRHGGVSVDLGGDALDCVIPAGNGALQIMVAGALLGAFRSFHGPMGEKINGAVVLHSRIRKNMILIAVYCSDEADAARFDCSLDPVSLWLLGEIAREAGGHLQAAHSVRRRHHLSMAFPR